MTSSNLATGTAAAALRTLTDTTLRAAVDTRIGLGAGNLDAIAAAAIGALSTALYTDRTTKNLYNPADADVLVGYTLNNAGPVVSASYTTTGYIPVVAGTPYTLSNPRFYQLTDASKVIITGTSVSDSLMGPHTVVPTTNGYLRASFNTATYASTFQVEVGTDPTTYAPWFAGTIHDIDPAFAQAVANGIPLPTAGPASVTKAGGAVAIASDLAGAQLVINVDMTHTASNGAFDFGLVTLDGVTIHNGADDPAPIRTQEGTTLGANHGYPNVATFTNPDSKTSADLGAVYQSSNGHEYVILGVTGSLVTIGGSYTTVNGVVTSANVNPTTNLTWVSGGTHHGAIDYTTKVATQLYPSVGKRRVTLYIDGEPTTTDGTYSGYRVEFRETYEILDYGDLYDKAKANVGTSYAALNVLGRVRVTNVYTYLAGKVCLLDTTLEELRPTDLGVSGGVQALALAATSATLTRYIPGLSPISGYDFAAGVDMTSYATSLKADTTNLLAAGVPPAFHLDKLTISGSTLVGFAMGYPPYAAADSSNAARIADATSPPTDYLYDLRDTKKIYPTAVNSKSHGWGRVTFKCFRAYLSPAQTDAVAGITDALAAWAALSTVAPIS